MVHASSIVESPPKVSISAHWRDETDTLAFAQKLATRPGIANAFIELRGDLGAGKTSFVRHLLHSLGIKGRIKSPTYAVVEPYAVELPDNKPVLEIWHFDFYRFNDPREWEDAGFRELFASPGLKIAEWAEKAREMLPTADLVIELTALDEDARLVNLIPQTLQGKELLA